MELFLMQTPPSKWLEVERRTGGWGGGGGGGGGGEGGVFLVPTCM